MRELPPARDTQCSPSRLHQRPRSTVARRQAAARSRVVRNRQRIENNSCRCAGHGLHAPRAKNGAMGCLLFGPRLRKLCRSCGTDRFARANIQCGATAEKSGIPRGPMATLQLYAIWAVLSIGAAGALLAWWIM